MLSPWAEDLWLLFLVSILTLVGVVDEDVYAGEDVRGV